LRVKDLLEQNYEFGHDVSALKAILKNPEDLRAYLEIDDYYMNGLIAYFLKAKDPILNTLAHDFLNRHICEYMDDDKEHQEQIETIHASYNEQDRKYFTLKTSVEQGAYLENEFNLGDQIYVVTEKG